MIKSFLTKELTSDDIENKGQKNYKLGKFFMFCGVCGLALLVVISLIVVAAYSTYTLFNYVLLLNTLSGIGLVDFLVNVLVFVSYASILLGFIGIPLYFYGINLFALGRIAHNTEKE